MTQPFNFEKSALAVIDTEISALNNIKRYVNDSFNKSCELVLNNIGRLIVIGMGKSGHIGNKIAATLASTGTPSFFVHPAEASHGDLGMITEHDVVLAISNSGETDELTKLIPLLKRIGVPIIGMSGNPNSTLAKESTHHICIAVEQEACPLGLAPTSSTTATLAMGDALAIALLEARGFTKQDFAFSHPAGSLGRKLLLRVADLMHKGSNLPIVSQDSLIAKALVEISRKGMGFAAVVNKNNQVVSSFTDGDLRRTLDNRIDIHQTQLKAVIHQGCITVTKDMLAAEALSIMEEKRINGLVVVDDNNTPIGAINMHDLLKAKVL